MPTKVSTKTRNDVGKRAKNCCEYCMSQQQYSHDYLIVEHIIPVAKGGSSRIGNLALSCQACNNHKYIFTEATDPVSGTTVSLFHPRKQTWKEHFMWDKTFGYMIGLTPTDRATIDRLHLNRPNLVNLRLALTDCKKHPPSQSI